MKNFASGEENMRTVFLHGQMLTTVGQVRTSSTDDATVEGMSWL